MKGCLGVVFKREKGLASCLDSHRRKVKVQTLLNIPLVLGLTLSVHHSSSKRHNCLSWEHHRKVLLLEEEQCQKGAPAAGSSIQELAGHHKCASSVGKPAMLRDFIQ